MNATVLSIQGETALAATERMWADLAAADKTPEAALSRLIVAGVVKCAEQGFVLPRFSRMYRCDVKDAEHWHMTHWSTESRCGNAWPSPWWPAAEVDPYL